MINIVLLERKHRRLLKDFRNQHQSLVDYLNRFALRHMEKDLLSKTYLAIDEEQERLAGYFSLSVCSLERGLIHEGDLAKLPKLPIPGVLLAKLAVDTRAQGQGLGRYLFEEGLGQAIRLGQEGPTRVRVLVVDAIDEKAVSFYEYFGMKRLSEDYPCRMVFDLKRFF